MCVGVGITPQRFSLVFYYPGSGQVLSATDDNESYHVRGCTMAHLFVLRLIYIAYNLMHLETSVTDLQLPHLLFVRTD